MVAIASAFIALAGLPAGQVNNKVDLDSLKTSILSAAKGFRGTFGFCVRDMETGKVIDSNGDVIFPTASTIKTGVMVDAIDEVNEGKYKWSDKHPLPPPDHREASMWTYFLRDGVEPDMDAYVNLMIYVSDNTALITLRNWLTPQAINARMESLGLKNTKVLRSYPGDPADLADLNHKWGMGMTTPDEMNKLFYLIATNKAGSPAACDKMLRILGRYYWDDTIGSSIPPQVRYCDKSGAVDASRSDNAIVYGPHPYILTLYTKDNVDQSWTEKNEALVLIRKEAAIVWAAFNPKWHYELPKGSDKYTATGGGV